MLSRTRRHRLLKPSSSGASAAAGAEAATTPREITSSSSSHSSEGKGGGIPPAGCAAAVVPLPTAAALPGRRTARARAALRALVLLLLLVLMVLASAGGVVAVVSYLLLPMMRGGTGGAGFGGFQMSLSSGFPSTLHQQHQQREKKRAIAAIAAAAAAPFQADGLPGASAAAGRQGSASHVGDAAGATAAGPNASLLSRQVVSLPVTYDPVPATAAAEGSGCFCVPWDVDSDGWWSQHGAEWTVDSTRENATHTCYVRRSAAQEQHFRRMYQVQLGSDRSNNANCTLRKMWSDGFASDLRNLMDGLVQALQSGVPFTPDATPWHYAALQDHSRPACLSDLAPTYLRGDVTPSCFFLPLSNCVNRRDIVKDRGIVTYADGRPPSFVKNGHLLQFILRPRQWVRRHVFRRSHDLRQQLLEALQDSNVTDAAGTAAAAAAGRRSRNRALLQGCTVVHVRRGDVVLGNSRSTSRRKYRPLADYLLHVRTRTVLLLTDDSDAIAESRQQAFANYTFVSWNRTRYRGSEGGWEEHLPSRDPLEEMAVLLGTFDVVPLCHAIVHTASNFGQLLYALMVHGASSSRHRIPTKSGGVRRVNLDALTQQKQQKQKQKEQQKQQRPVQASVVP
jgi:hypothetical protein